MTINRTSTKSLDQTCEDLHTAVSKHKFGVLTVHDLAQTMAKKGVEFDGECRIFEVCNPHQAKKVLESNPEISTALPCRISVYTQAGEVKLSTISPSMMLGMFGADDIQAVAEEVEATLTAIMDDTVS
ncbi:MAG: DUF302 domain-containing protein [Verrucomicrobiales bacterium]|nr:DUF302 domain-containing protein [Verrucomicrobiales bacterium]